MVDLTIVTQTNIETVYFDELIPKVDWQSIEFLAQSETCMYLEHEQIVHVS